LIENQSRSIRQHILSSHAELGFKYFCADSVRVDRPEVEVFTITVDGIRFPDYDPETDAAEASSFNGWRVDLVGEEKTSPMAPAVLCAASPASSTGSRPDCAMTTPPGRGRVSSWRLMGDWDRGVSGSDNGSGSETDSLLCDPGVPFSR
jgi:hypothetical protein